MTHFDVTCPHCQSGIGIACKTISGRACGLHKDRIDAFDETIRLEREEKTTQAAHAALVVPAIEAQPRQLKEKFTFKGDPLKLSVCMRHLGFNLVHVADTTFCEKREGKQLTVTYLHTPTGWEFGVRSGDEDLKTHEITESKLLSNLIKRFYMVPVKQRAGMSSDVLASLTQYLLPLATAAELDTLRSEIKACRPSRA